MIASCYIYLLSYPASVGSTEASDGLQRTWNPMPPTV